MRTELTYDFEPDPFEDGEEGKTCRHCGARGLWWFPAKRDSYFLKNPDGTQHNCLRVPASPDEFEAC